MTAKTLAINTQRKGYTCIEVKNLKNCKMCDLEYNWKICKDVGECAAKTRSDKKNVIWKKQFKEVAKNKKARSLIKEIKRKNIERGNINCTIFKIISCSEYPMRFDLYGKDIKDYSKIASIHFKELSKSLTKLLITHLEKEKRRIDIEINKLKKALENIYGGVKCPEEN